MTIHWILGKIEFLSRPSVYSEEITALIHQMNNKYERLEKKYEKGQSLLKEVIGILKIKGYENIAKDIETYLADDKK